MTPRAVRSSDGVGLAVVEGGTPSGPELLFVHGFCQSHRCWDKQFSDPALQHCRLVAFDLRGHGASGKPQARTSYESDQLWADDIDAVMTGTGLQRPILVGWSYGARLVLDYLRIHGAARIAGVNFVASSLRTTTNGNAPRPDLALDLLSDDLPIRLEATRQFLRRCFASGLDHQDFEHVLAANMLVPAGVRRFILARAPPAMDLESLADLPILISHGSNDPIMSPDVPRSAAARLKTAAFSLYQDAGHAVFFEQPDRFNRELADFVHAANTAAPTGPQHSLNGEPS